MVVNINRQKLGIEDLTFGVGTETQTRQGQQVEITQINAANLPFSASQTLQEVLDTNYPSVDIVGDNIISVNTVAGNIVSVNIVSDNKDIIRAVYSILNYIALTGSNIGAVTTVANDLSEPVSEINTVANNMGTLDIIGSDLSGSCISEIQDNGSVSDPVTQGTCEGSVIEIVAESIEDVQTLAALEEQIIYLAEHWNEKQDYNENILIDEDGFSLDLGSL